MRRTIKSLPRWDLKFPIDDNGYINFSMLLIARRRSGKSYLIRHLYLSRLYDKYNMIIIVTTASNMKFYKKFVRQRSTQKIKYYDCDKIDSLNFLEPIKKLNAKKSGKSIVNTLLIFDDTNSRKQRYNEELLHLYTRGRHFNLSIIYTAQSVTLTDTHWRENSDFIILYHVETRNFKEYISKYLIGNPLRISFDTAKKEKQFYIKLLDKITGVKYQSLIIKLFDNGGAYKYKAPKFVK